MSSSETYEYFSDGITEEIINALAQIDTLKVTSRTSSFFFKNKNIPIKAIGKTLNAAIILEGSVRLSKNTIRITAQLIQAADDFHFWSATWDRNPEDIFEVQDEISVEIADKLREQLGHFEIQEHLVNKQTHSFMAYEYSLKAKYYRNRWNPEEVKQAIAWYERAIQLDPSHSESYAGLADCYSFLGTIGFIPFEEAWEKCAAYTAQAQQLNANLSSVHYQRSNIAFFTACDYEKSLEEMKKAIDINPNNAEARQFMSFLYIIAGNRQASRKHLDIAMGINPLSEETQLFNAYFHYMCEDYGKALPLLDRCLQANSKNIPAHAVKANCLLKMGRYDEALTYFEEVPQEVIIPAEQTGTMALAYAMKGDVENANHYLNLLEAEAKAPNGFTADVYCFMLYVATGAIDKAFDWVAHGIKNKSALLTLRYADPLVNALKADPRYQQYKAILFAVENNSERSENSGKALLDKNKAERYSEQLLHHIKANKPYLDPSLSLRTLASQVGMPPNQLSWLLNENLGKNFNEFINHYRVENFKALAQDPKNAHITIMGLAYDSGFNSKTVFNTYFKKETGLTPRQFLNS